MYACKREYVRADAGWGALYQRSTQTGGREAEGGKNAGEVQKAPGRLDRVDVCTHRSDSVRDPRHVDRHICQPVSTAAHRQEMRRARWRRGPYAPRICGSAVLSRAGRAVSASNFCIRGSGLRARARPDEGEGPPFDDAGQGIPPDPRRIIVEIGDPHGHHQNAFKDRFLSVVVGSQRTVVALWQGTAVRTRQVQSGREKLISIRPCPTLPEPLG